MTEIHSALNGHRHPARKPVTEGMRKRRRGAYELGPFGKRKPNDPTPRLSTTLEQSAKGTHGLLSPFDTLPLQGTCHCIQCSRCHSYPVKR